MIKSLLYFLCFLGTVFCTSCNKEKLKSPQASFLVVDKADVSATSGQGTNSHNITDIWFYVNGQFQGAYPVGNVMPIVASNDADIMMYPGIKNNGISTTRQPYIFYKAIEFNKNIEAGKTYTVSPIFEYKSGLSFVINDNFESTGSQFIPYSFSDSSYVLTTDPNKTFGGIGKSVFISMSDAKPNAGMESGSDFSLPSTGEPVYLELNYKCNQQITVGVIGVNGSAQAERISAAINPSSNWNKIYIQLTSSISSPPTYTRYKVFIKAVKTTNTPEIYIDNVKLIY